MLKYLSDWEKSVCEREGYKDMKKEQNMMLLPLETHQGIEITSELQRLVQLYYYSL